ncbi:retrotransposon protein, putative, ty1-copia subclass [Tanacetum coccineum]
MFQANASKERLDVVKSLMPCKLKPGAFICAFVLEMKGLCSRIKNEKETSIMELHSLLQTAEQGIKKIDVPSTSAAPMLTIGHNGLKESRRLKHRELNLVKGNKKITLVTKIGNHNGNVILNVGLSNELDKSKLWHSRLGHINKKHIVQLQKDGVLESFDFKSDDVYESCLLGKITKSPFTGSCERGQGLLDLVHRDVCGPFLSAIKDGKRYYVTFTDDFSRYGYVYLIKYNSDTFKVFKRYQNKVENQVGRKIKVLRSDRGGEYLSIEFSDL